MALPHFTSIAASRGYYYNDQIINSIGVDRITFEYYAEEFEQINNDIFKTIKVRDDLFYVTIERKNYSRLLKITGLLSNNSELLNKLEYFIDSCDSKRMQQRVINEIIGS